MQPSDWYKMGMSPPVDDPTWDRGLQMPIVNLSPEFPSLEDEAAAQAILQADPPNRLVYLRWLYLEGILVP